MKTNKILVSAFAFSIAFASFTSCSSDSSSLPPIGGYNSADEVAASSLKAYWPLDGNGKESVSNTSPSATVATTYVTGVKGQAANFNSGYMAYPEIAALNTTSGSASISAWVKVSNNKVDPTAVSTTSPIFSLTRTGEAFGNIGEVFGDLGKKVSSFDEFYSQTVSTSTATSTATTTDASSASTTTTTTTITTEN